VRLDRRKIERLEAKHPKVGVAHTSGELEEYYRALESYEREEQGLPPLPYNEVDRKSDEDFLSNILPMMRSSLGWQTEEAQRKLDEMEEGALYRLQNGVNTDG
jgi:hypothetical protein